MKTWSKGEGRRCRLSICSNYRDGNMLTRTNKLLKETQGIIRRASEFEMLVKHH